MNPLLLTVLVLLAVVGVELFVVGLVRASRTINQTVGAVAPGPPADDLDPDYDEEEPLDEPRP